MPRRALGKSGSSDGADPLSSYKRQKLDNFPRAPYDKEDLLIGKPTGADRSKVALMPRG
ncbi:hypothetical protein [Oceanobacillus jeddahense]|uniref:hypothetical protein n=1 Tax=Oceanobacillus jeddahense TaxID=1462527 RepID=UPI0012ED0A17|nr:hypothetical protein [Oceanobacillus jeddahense]